MRKLFLSKSHQRNLGKANKLNNQNTISRTYFFDNAKFWLITLVVIAHVLIGPTFSPTISYNNHFLQSFTILIFIFMMQAFSFISGIFSKNILTDEYLQKSLMQLIIPYIILATLAEIIAKKYTTGYLLDPPPVLWYLLALFVWRIALVVARQIKLPILIILSFTAAITVGFETRVSYFLSLSRIFTFFPFFLLGHFYGQKLLRVEFKYQKIVALGIFFFVFIGIWNYFPIDSRYLLMGVPYKDLGDTNSIGALIRIVLILMSLLLLYSFFLLIPKKETIFSRLGTQSIYVYLLHPFIILGLFSLGIYNNPSLLVQSSFIPFAFILSVILSSKWVEKIFSPILFPKIAKKLFIPIGERES